MKTGECGLKGQGIVCIKVDALPTTPQKIYNLAIWYENLTCTFRPTFL